MRITKTVAFAGHREAAIFLAIDLALPFGSPSARLLAQDVPGYDAVWSDHALMRQAQKEAVRLLAGKVGLRVVEEN